MLARDKTLSPGVVEEPWLLWQDRTQLERSRRCLRLGCYSTVRAWADGNKEAEADVGGERAILQGTQQTFVLWPMFKDMGVQRQL